MDLNCTLLCASGAAYDINPVTGIYTPDILFGKNVAFQSPGPIVINNSGTDKINACLVGKNSTGIIVAFRGTLPPGTPDSFGDWLEDFFAEPGPCDSFPGKVHSGFCQDINAIFPAVLDAVTSLDPASNPVYVTGHSKGGALASLGAYLLSRAGISVKQVVTFASPKVGDRGFQAGYQRVIPNQIRYENDGDIVPLMPPADEFITDLADVVEYIPDIGSRLAALIR
ncbi:MAG: lipase family protein, partial [Gammaproteobacteria bacterium]